ncbi:hypothetical protein Spb1_02700 [Planctopirus ephydatiae]|uniref:Uncharacterized protein n=1 Tax=Planctopirus ephydatiae TaxID=2528019 RepID=A0A518GII7_9PLAN|nr:hypothetical protein Spb1_02700 [Planctopirus ephydatiae]
MGANFSHGRLFQQRKGQHRIGQNRLVKGALVLFGLSDLVEIDGGNAQGTGTLNCFVQCRSRLLMRAILPTSTKFRLVDDQSIGQFQGLYQDQRDDR